MPDTTGSEPSSGRRTLARAAKIIIVSSVMFTFISYWRTAAVVLCDLASTAYYIGGIVETAIGPAAPWFILAVMLFSYAVRSVYLESCSLFVRGGVYRVVKEAMGGFLAKLSVSALMFDYVLTGPISGVSAGQYIIGLVLDTIAVFWPELKVENEATKTAITNYGAAGIASAITIYFFWQNLIGIHESSDKAVKIMILTTIMGVVLLGWCGVTIVAKWLDPNLQPRMNSVPLEPNLQPKMNYDKNEVEDPLGFLAKTRLGMSLRNPEVYEVGVSSITIFDRKGEKQEFRLSRQVKITLDGNDADLAQLHKGTRVTLTHDKDSSVNTIAAFSNSGINWLSLIGVIGLLLAFGHSILAMSGEETLAQVYREVESPKMPNFKKAAFVVFVYSLALTSAISFLAVMLIPDEVRMKDYHGNLIGGLAMNVLGPKEACLCLNGFVVVVGFLILAGAVNTAIIGSNGVLNRVADDGVLPTWFLKPHPRYGTTYRVLYLIVALQLLTILVSRGDVIALGEAYAFGVVWSFVFKALAMVVLRFRDKSPREFKVPLNLRLGKIEIPFGLITIFLILLAAALLNLFTKTTATIAGGLFTLAFWSVFMVTEYYHERRRRGLSHQHLEQFNQEAAEAVTPGSLGLRRPYRKLVAIRSPQNLRMLEKTLSDTDPETTDVVVMTAKVSPAGDSGPAEANLDAYDQELMTAVVQLAEKAGKQVKPVILPTNNPLYAVIRTAKDLQAQELVMGASNKYTADEQLDQIAFYWVSLHDGSPAPLTVRILGRERDVHLDLAGGNRIPKISERKARSVEELRAAGVGVDRVLLVHDDTPDSSDLFQAVLTMLDPKVTLGVVPLVKSGTTNGTGNGALQHDLEQAKQLDREIDVLSLPAGELESEILRLAQGSQYDLIVVNVPLEPPPGLAKPLDATYLLRHATCRVFVTAPPALPPEPEA
jgi:amino acid transporter/nucleotide-binding universal stress UspA family protein